MLMLAFFGLLGMQVYAQKTVTGTVTSSADGAVLPGVTVIVKGTAIGTVTDIDGKYSISVPSDGTSLVFSFVGMVSQEVTITGNTANCALESADIQIDEFVVTAMGISKDKKALGYSVQDLSGDDFNKARETNIVNSLSGQIAGVQVTSSSGAVGSSSRIVLRGATSITGNNEPLFIVDGVPINNTNYGDGGSTGGSDQPSGSADINPDDIETISVLKGANAAALYGSRAANGVIIIKTKTGKGNNGVTFSSSITTENPLKLPDFQNSYGQGASNKFFEFIDGSTDAAGVDESWGMPLDIGLQATQFHNDSVPQDWISVPSNIKDFYDTGLTFTNNIAFSGGGEDASFRLSFTNSQQKGMVPNTSLGKNTINGSSSINITKKLYTNFSVNYVKMHSDNLPIGGYSNENPVQQMIWSGRNVDFEKLRDYENLPLAAEGTAAAGTPINWNTVFQNNPFWLQDHNLTRLDKDRVIGNLEVGYKFTDWLTFKIGTGTDYWSSVTAVQKFHGSNQTPNGFYSESFRNWYETNTDAMILINKSFGDKIDFALNLGGNRMMRYYENVYGEAAQLQLEGVFNLSNVLSGVTPTLSNYIEKRKINSLYYNTTISYGDFLYLETSGRNDWSSVLPVENNSFFYPSFSIADDITTMLDIKSNFLSFLKIRGGWAMVGGDGALDPYSLSQTFLFRSPDNTVEGGPWGDVLLPFNGATLNNPNLTSETTTSIEVGLDMRLWNGRVTLDLSYYDTKSKDLIVPVEVSAATGYTSIWDNIGEMRNRGVEALVGFDIVDNDNFKWTTTINLSKPNNEVVSLGGLESLDLGGQWNMTLQAREGMPYGVIFGPAFKREPNADGSRNPEGAIIYENGLPQVDETYQILGDIQPDWTGGINNAISFKGLELSCLVDAKIGGEIYSMTNSWGRYAGVLSETLAGREGGVVGEGVIMVVNGSDTTFRENDVVVTAEAFNKAAFADGVVESSVFDASYVKLRQVSIGYTISKIGNLPIEDISLNLIGRNLAILYSKCPHIDPETAFSSENGEQGQEFGQLPTARSLGFSINFKF